MSVFVVLVGVIMGGLKLAAIGPFEKMSWWWISIPFIVVVIIWEVLTPIFGWDKKKEHADIERAKQKRIEKNRSGRPDVNM